MVQLKEISGIVLFAVLAFVAQVQSHGMMLDPVGRASRWRYNNSAPKNYNDNGLYCGGFNHQWAVNKGKCGLCGDDFSLHTPRPHEIGGLYGEGVIVKTYNMGNIISVGVEITANHKGHFYFHLCDLDRSQENENCYQKYPVKLPDGSDKYWLPSTNSGWYNLKLRLPKGVSCRHCSLRWTYVAGNNWGLCPNGTGAVGCGPQENFRSCADIRISGTSYQNPLELNDKTFLSNDDEDNYYFEIDNTLDGTDILED